MERKIYDVLPNHGAEGLEWKVKLEGTQKASRVLAGKDEAIAVGKGFAKNSELGQLRIHDKFGVIQTEYTYGKDPKKYKG